MRRVKLLHMCLSPLLLPTEMSVDLSVELCVICLLQEFRATAKGNVTEERRGWKGSVMIYQDINTSKPF